MRDEKPLVICLKQGSALPALSVNALHRSAEKHIEGLHCFVCLTNDPADVDCEIVPILYDLEK